MNSKCDEIFNVNIKRLALLALPTWLRRPLVGVLIYAGVFPLVRLTHELRKYRSSTRYRLRHNGQVCKLRGVLNDEFDPEQRRIVIEDQNNLDGLETSTIWQREVERWIMVPQRDCNPVRINREGFGGANGYDFWVIIPAELKDSETETRLRAVVNMYKLASKRYAINYK